MILAPEKHHAIGIIHPVLFRGEVELRAIRLQVISLFRCITSRSCKHKTSRNYHLPTPLTWNEIAAHLEAYLIPNSSCTCSSGTPFVSMTMVFTQISCRTIMPQKNRKT